MKAERAVAMGRVAVGPSTPRIRHGDVFLKTVNRQPSHTGSFVCILMLRVTEGFRHETRHFFGCTTSVPRLLQRRRNKVGLHERSELRKRWGHAECCWAEPMLICSMPCASSEVVWYYCSANFTPRFELTPVQINACPGVESTRFWQENNFHWDHVAGV